MFSINADYKLITERNLGHNWGAKVEYFIFTLHKDIFVHL